VADPFTESPGLSFLCHKAKETKRVTWGSEILGLCFLLKIDGCEIS